MYVLSLSIIMILPSLGITTTDGLLVVSTNVNSSASSLIPSLIVWIVMQAIVMLEGINSTKS